MAVVRPQIQPPRGTDAGQPEQRLHPRLPAVPGLRTPGGSACEALFTENLQKSVLKGCFLLHAQAL